MTIQTVTTQAVPAGDPQQAKLVNAAQSFEAMMLNEMMKPLHFGNGVDEGGDESGEGAAGTIRGMGTETLSKALSAHGGLGIAQKIVAEVTREHDAAMAKKVRVKSYEGAPIH